MKHVRLFKPRFAPLVESGSKNQTVRPTPKRMPKPGDWISLRIWTDKPYRSKQRVLRMSVITKVDRVEIWPAGGLIAVGSCKLQLDSAYNFARADGFRDQFEMFDWFVEQYGSEKFEGIVIYWK